MFKRFFAIILALALTLSFSPSISATSLNQESDWLAGEFSTAFIEANGVTLEVPIIRQQASAARASDGIHTITETVFVPDMTEESLAKNTRIVSEIKAYGAPATRGYGDFYVSGYIWFHSTLNYTTTTYASQTLYDLISFKLEREIYTNAPFNNFHNATARAVQIGSSYPEIPIAEIYNQDKHYGTIAYNQLYSIPGAWVPVRYIEHDIGVQYAVLIDFYDQPDYTLYYTHKAV